MYVRGWGRSNGGGEAYPSQWPQHTQRPAQETDVRHRWRQKAQGGAPRSKASEGRKGRDHTESLGARSSNLDFTLRSTESY